MSPSEATWVERSQARAGLGPANRGRSRTRYRAFSASPLAPNLQDWTQPLVCSRSGHSA